MRGLSFYSSSSSYGARSEGISNNSSYSKETSTRSKKYEKQNSGSFNLRSLSKLMLPPLGASSHGLSQSDLDGSKVISPLDSRYR
jgi:potassium channel